MNDNDYRLKMLHELEHLNRTLEKLLKLPRRPRENDNPSVYNQQDADKENSDLAHGATFLPDFGPRPQSTTEARSKPYNAAYWQNRHLEWWKQRLEITAFIFAIGYAVVTFFQWRDSNTNFREDETPYLWPKVGEPVFVDGQPPMIPFDYSNVGKTPAMAIQFCMYTMYGRDISSMVHEISLETCDKEGLPVHSGGRVLPPNANGSTQNIKFVNSIYHDADKPVLASRDNVLAIQGVIQYEDIFHRTWEMGWCFHRMKEGNMSECSQFSYIREKPKKRFWQK